MTLVFSIVAASTGAKPATEIVATAIVDKAITTNEKLRINTDVLHVVVFVMFFPYPLLKSFCTRIVTVER